MNKSRYRLILGSASPRRQELLKSLGYEFELNPVKADESSWPAGLRAGEIPLFLAEHKSLAFDRELKKGELLITADTVVWCEGRVFNKPVDRADAFRMLRDLSGKMHQVFTAVVLRSAEKTVQFCDETRVYFKQLSDAEIDYYLHHYKPYDKAGAYGVQEWIGYIAIDKIEGSFYNVMGLPVKRLYEELERFNIG